MTLYGERLWPRKEEKEVNTHVMITLTAHQAARITAEVSPTDSKIEVEEVPYEVIATEFIESHTGTDG
jgi:hypothetical protein